jgi:hypothetical protein
MLTCGKTLSPGRIKFQEAFGRLRYSARELNKSTISIGSLQLYYSADQKDSWPWGTRDPPKSPSLGKEEGELSKSRKERSFFSSLFGVGLIKDHCTRKSRPVLIPSFSFPFNRQRLLL